MDDMKEVLRSLDEKYPISPHTGVGALVTTLRRMQAERELKIPMALRTGRVIAIEHGKRANELDEATWEKFYCDLRDKLKRDYPQAYADHFPEDN